MMNLSERAIAHSVAAYSQLQQGLEHILRRQLTVDPGFEIAAYQCQVRLACQIPPNLTFFSADAHISHSQQNMVSHRLGAAFRAAGILLAPTGELKVAQAPENAIVIPILLRGYTDRDERGYQQTGTDEFLMPCDEMQPPFGGAQVVAAIERLLAEMRMTPPRGYEPS